jgi:hypothetical protein
MAPQKPERELLAEAVARSPGVATLAAGKMTIGGPQDLYVLVKRLIETLDSKGEPGWARRLEGALYISNVGSEVMAELRLELRGLEATPVPTQTGIAHDVDESLSYLDGVLSRLFD